ncbi:MAG: dihydroorotate dehydrogenase electron transfer subunit [Desulfobacterales bacterium]|jgi:dihydroorotate dehydrogenase electron transfer subunit
MIQRNLEILWNREAGPDYYRIGLKCHGGYGRAKPGQFIMMRLSEQNDPLLRRPFSIHRLVVNRGRTEGIEVLYKAVGKGTLKLTTFKPGDDVDVLGPLGSAFILPGNARHIFIVAGGIGVAPMVFLASFLMEKGADPSCCQVFLGGKTRGDLLCVDDFSHLGMSVHTATDDGSAGDQCLVTHPVELALQDAKPDIIYACGPLEMLQCVLGITEKYDVPCQISLETRMACGLGACLGCAVARRDESSHYLHACLDGPVFDTREIIL